MRPQRAKPGPVGRNYRAAGMDSVQKPNNEHFPSRWDLGSYQAGGFGEVAQGSQALSAGILYYLYTTNFSFFSYLFLFSVVLLLFLFLLEDPNSVGQNYHYAFHVGRIP